ncbi:hypothetical protein [Nocardia phage P3.1]|nr:hypothetical protein [Nocardia phage P3.1]
MSRNKWTDEMLAKDYHLGSKREAALIAQENGSDPAVKCGNCGEVEGYYKGTVGAVVCYVCGSVRVRRVARAGDQVRPTNPETGFKFDATVTEAVQREVDGKVRHYIKVAERPGLYPMPSITTWSNPRR